MDAAVRPDGPPRRWHSLLALAGAAVLALSACGGGGGGDGAGGATGAALAATTGGTQGLQAQAAPDPGATWYRITRLPVASEAGFVGRDGLNAAGQVAGVEVTAEGGRGFFFDGRSTRYFSPPAPAGSGEWKTGVRFVGGLNAAGQVVGSYDFQRLDAAPGAGREGYEAFSWSAAGGFVRIDPSPLGGALRVNDAGQVAGARGSARLEPQGSEGFLWSAAGGAASDFGPGTELAEAAALDDAGRISGPGRYLGQLGALLVDPAAGSTRLLVAAEKDYVKVADMNRAGQVAGEVLTAADRFHAFVTDPSGALTRLGPLLGAGDDSFVQDLNERGEVVLQVRVAGRPPETGIAAYFWSQADGMIEMKTPARAHAIPVALNDQGLAVGYHDEWKDGAYVGSRAFAWTKAGGLVDLAARVQDAPPGLRLHAALAVNGQGTIVASSSEGLVLLTPAGTAQPTP